MWAASRAVPSTRSSRALSARARWRPRDSIASVSDRFPDEEETHTTSAPTGPVSTRAHPHLLVLDGVNIGRSHRITKRVTVLGRSSGTTLQFPDHGVSRRHAKITRAGSDLVLEDLASANGTF